jgi:hypothetical protein
MKSYRIGNIHGTKTPFEITKDSFSTHWHLIGHTGKGKTTAIHTLLHRLLLDPTDESCVIIVDRMGNLSFDLLLWMASEFCSEDVRERLVYIEPAREDVVMGFNPLLHETEAHAYYRVCHASELILRGWTSQNLGEMPRLARWLFNSFYACSLLGLTIADSAHLIFPGSKYHQPILRSLPPLLQAEWDEIMKARGSEASRILESARNRLKPFHESPILRHMFGATTNRLDIGRFMKEKKILVLNLHPGNRLPEQVVDAIGGLVINEVITTARSLPFVKYPTYLLLDEFQNFVGPDIESSLPEVRQLQIRMILSHQSFSQLKQGDIDLTSMIFQAQSRMIFGMQGEDADIIAQELASLRYNPMKIKDEIMSRRQRISGHRIEELKSWGTAKQLAQNWADTYGASWGTKKGTSWDSRGNWYDVQMSDGNSNTDNKGSSSGGSESKTESENVAQHLVPEYEEYLELSSRTFTTFDEEWHSYGRDVRELPTGQAFVRLVNKRGFEHVDIKRSVPGHLALPPHLLAEEMPDVLEDVEKLIQRNFEADYFCSPQAIERETEKRLSAVLSPQIDIGSGVIEVEPCPVIAAPTGPNTVQDSTIPMPKTKTRQEAKTDHGFL